MVTERFWFIYRLFFFFFNVQTVIKIFLLYKTLILIEFVLRHFVLFLTSWPSFDNY